MIHGFCLNTSVSLEYRACMVFKNAFMSGVGRWAEEPAVLPGPQARSRVLKFLNWKIVLQSPHHNTHTACTHHIHTSYHTHTHSSHTCHTHTDTHPKPYTSHHTQTHTPHSQHNTHTPFLVTVTCVLLTEMKLRTSYCGRNIISSELLRDPHTAPLT